MRWTFRILVLSLLILSLLASSCEAAPRSKSPLSARQKSITLPPEPRDPSQSSPRTTFTGRAFYAELGNLGYANPGDVFTLSSDKVEKGKTLTLSVSEAYIYKYYYLALNGKWVQYSFPQKTIGSSNWISSSAEAVVDTNNPDLPPGDNYVVAYSCSKTASGFDCHGSRWMIHQFTVLPASGESTPPPDGQPGDGGDEGSEEKTPPKKFESYCGDDFSDKIIQKEVWSLDFEDVDDSGWIADWSRPKGKGGKDLLPTVPEPSFVLDSDVKHNGARSLRISSASTSAYGVIVPSAAAGQVKVQPGKEYVLSYWIKGDEVISKTNHLSINHVFMDKLTNKPIYWFVYFPSDQTIPQTYDWKKVMQKFKAPENVKDEASVTILFQDGSGTIWLDDIIMMPAEIFDSLPTATLDVEAGTLEKNSPSRHYFLREGIIKTKVGISDNKGISADYLIKAKLSYCGKELKNSQQVVKILPNERKEVNLIDIDPKSLALGDYMLSVSLESLEKEGLVIDSVEYPLGLRLEPKKDFLYSLLVSGRVPDRPSANNKLDKFKQYRISPLHSGEPSKDFADAALGKDMSFSARLIPEVQLPPKIGPFGDQLTGNLKYGLSDTSMQEQAAAWMKRAVQHLSNYPAFFPRIFTSDDFQLHSGWDWSDVNKQKFKQMSGMDAPVPKEMEDADKDDKFWYYVSSFNYPKGSVELNEPWLAYNNFLSKEVLGGYNKALADGVKQADPDALIGPIPGPMQWPLFHVASGQYPPSNFGPNGFSMISYYFYQKYWRPELAYIYWTDISRMNNKGLPVYVMADATVPEKSTIWHDFYLLLAAGVEGVEYFVEGEATNEFWEVSKEVIGPVAEKLGSLLVQLRPQKPKIGLLVSQTTAAYNNMHPLEGICKFSNLMMAHVDVVPISEEEILNGEKYDAIILSDIDWLRSDVVQKLSSLNIPVLLDQDTEVSISGSHVQKLNLKLMEGSCASYDPDYGKKDRLAAIRTEIGKVVPQEVFIDSDSVIYRKYKAGDIDGYIDGDAEKDAEYLWLVDLHSTEEYVKMWEWMTYKEGYNNPSVAIDYLDSKGVYAQKTSAKISIKTSGEVAVVDILTGEVLDSSFKDGLTTFGIDIPRLKGKLVALYSTAPNLVSIDISNVAVGKEAILSVSVHSAGGPAIKSVFPIYLEVKDPKGKVYSYSRYAATDEFGKYQLPVIFGTNDPKGTWSIKVKELSTGKESSKTFIVS